MADPDGNEFCVLTPRSAGSGQRAGSLRNCEPVPAGSIWPAGAIPMSTSLVCRPPVVLRASRLADWRAGEQADDHGGGDDVHQHQDGGLSVGCAGTVGM